MEKENLALIPINKIINKKIIVAYIIVIILSMIIFVYSVFTYIVAVKPEKSYFFEKSDVDYSVFLKENNFFDEKYLTKNKQYVSDLIDYISPKFEYYLSLDNNDIEYIYSYEIKSKLDIQDKTTKNSLYSIEEEILSKKNIESNDNISIYENVNVDYNYYNNIVKEFVSSYSLDNTISNLSIEMGIKFNCKNILYPESFNKNLKITFDIPLNEKTFDISVYNDLLGNNLEFITFNKGKNNFTLILIAVFSIILITALIFKLIDYKNKVILAKDRFEKELQKILNDYSDYIQEIENKIDLTSYMILKISKFDSMIELRETLQSPVLMMRDEYNNKVSFIILKDKLCYIYELKMF